MRSFKRLPAPSRLKLVSLFLNLLPITLDEFMDFAVAQNKSLLPSGRVMEAMILLYLGRTAASVQERSEMTTQEAERAVQAQAEILEGLRSSSESGGTTFRENQEA